MTISFRLTQRNRMFLISTLALIIGSSLVVGILTSTREATNLRSASIGTLRQLGLAMQAYAMDHEGRFPSKFEELALSVNEPRLFVCPSSGRRPGELTNVSEWTDYTLVANRKENDPPETILAFCRHQLSRGYSGGCVLYTGGEVKWVADDRLRAIAAEVHAPSVEQ